ncbi:LPXTG cell wall anchor domain-containing protein [Enterococcus faecalis]|uniref:LPXTG cell wall anchor domain-containing protein n=1 Tax=Enterococcus faecalis TaxID=1351 RepID=UPI0013D0E52D|nr:LPXTG cell wall anchor domain-containing protein [Enterococcus faecalis]
MADSNLGNVRITNTRKPVVKSNKGNSSTPKKITLNKKYFPQTGEQQGKFLVILGTVIFIGLVIIFYKNNKK